MELNSGFFNAVVTDGLPDRMYNANDINDYFKGLVSENGIFANISTACQVTVGEDMQVIVRAGKGKVGGNYFLIEEDLTLDISASDVILNRIDTIAIRRDLDERNVSLVIKTGELSATPVAPTLTRDETVYEIGIANITVNKNVSAITASMIEDTRSNTSRCGWIVGLIEQFDTTTLFDQYKDAQETFVNESVAQYNEWYENAKESVKALNIYREYSSTYATVSENELTIAIPSSINYVVNSLDVLNVYASGEKIPESGYAIASDGSYITLYSSVTKGTVIEFINKKCVEGTVDESTILRVETLEEKVDAIGSYIYECTGTNDNVTLSEMVKNFLKGTGEFASVLTTSQLYIEVNGTLGIEALVNDDYVFDFNGSSNNRRVIVDFARATIPPLTFSTTSTLSVFDCQGDVKIQNANVSVTQNSANTAIWMCRGGKYENCKMYLISSTDLTGTVYGFYSCTTVTDCSMTIEKLNGTVYGAYSCYKLLYNYFSQYSGTSVYRQQAGIMIGNIVNKAMNISDSVINIGTLEV